MSEGRRMTAADVVAQVRDGRLEDFVREAAERVAHGLAANPTVFLRTKVQKELGLSPDVGGAARGDALVVGLTYAGAAVVPLWPYVFLPLMAPALITSILCTLVALFALGVAKGRIARQAWQRAGVQVMLIGSASAAVGFRIGHARSRGEVTRASLAMRAAWRQPSGWPGRFSGAPPRLA